MKLKFSVMPKEIKCWVCSLHKKNDIYQLETSIINNTNNTFSVYQKNFLVPYFNDNNYSIFNASFTTSWGSTTEITNFKIEKNSISFDYAESETSKDGTMVVSYEIIKNVDAVLKDDKKGIISQARISNIINENGNLIPNLEMKHLTYYDALPELTSNEFEKHLLYLNNGELKYIVGTPNNSYLAEVVNFKSDLLSSGGFLDNRCITFIFDGQLYILTENTEIIKYSESLNKILVEPTPDSSTIIGLFYSFKSACFYRGAIYIIRQSFGTNMNDYSLITGEYKSSGFGLPFNNYPHVTFSINDKFYALGVSEDGSKQSDFNIYKYDVSQNKFISLKTDSSRTILLYALNANVNGKIYLVGAGTAGLDVCLFDDINNTITKKGSLVNVIEDNSNISSVGNDIFISYPSLKKVVKYNTLTNSVSDFETFPENTSNCVLGNLGGSLYMLYCDTDGNTFTSIKKVTPNKTYKWKKITSVDA